MIRGRVFIALVGTWMLAANVVLCPAGAEASTSPADSSTAVPRLDTPAIAATSAPPGGGSRRSPGAAAGIGLAATVVPGLVASMMTSPTTTGGAVAVSVAGGAGILAGPAIGLWSGGRGDLARRGLLVRAIGGVALGAGVYALLTAFSENRNTGATTPLLLFGAGGGLLVTASMIHDIAITPSATARGRAFHAGLGIRGDGLVALRLQF